MHDTKSNDKIKFVMDALVVGVDVGSQTNYARALGGHGIEYSKEPLEFGNNKEGFQSLVNWSREIAAGLGLKRIVVGIEPTGHYWFVLRDYLETVSGMTLVLVNPHHVKKSKELDDNTQRKDDRKDPLTIARLVQEGRYMETYNPRGDYAELRILAEMQTEAKKMHARTLNQLNRWVDIYFPEYKGVYSDVDAKGGLMILEEAPLPEDIVKLGTAGVLAIWRKAKLRGAGEKRAKALVEAARRSCGRTEGKEAARMQLRELIVDVRCSDERINEHKKKLESALKKIKNAENLTDIKGIATDTASVIVAELGDIARFDNAKQVQKMAGLAIVAESSGKHKGKSKISRRGRKRLRTGMYSAALSVIRCNEEFLSLYQYFLHRKNNPLKKMQALIAVACKLLRVIYAILKKGIEYDGDRMLADIRRDEAAS